jgi:NAD(P)-dependent dehydrogenase (short-subunit alcohol dehydrogenase family)
MKRPPFRDHVVIVTGASSGVGHAVALQLAGQGAKVVLAARDGARLESVALACRERGGEGLAVPTDVSREVECRALIDRAVGAYGRIDVLVNNAGIGVGAALSELPDLRLFTSVMDVNFMGCVYCSYYALPHLREAKGRIVNVSSLGGKLALPFNTSYIASKHALVGFSDSLRMELAKDCVSVTVVSPYWVVTEFHERFLNKEGRPAGPSGRGIYTKRMMTADGCARVILKAAAGRTREVVMWPGPIGLWLKLLAPGLMDRVTLQMFLRPAVERVEKGRDISQPS